MKFKDLVEGKVYNNQYGIVDYTIKDGLLFRLESNKYSLTTVEEVSRMEFEELPWKPAEDEYYYIVDVTKEWGYDWHKNRNDKTDNRIFSRVKVYRTKEEAIAVAKELGWSIE